MVISIDAEKNIWQNPTTFHDKNTQKIRNRKFQTEKSKNPELALYT